MSQEHLLEIPKTARFHTHGNYSPQAEIWIAFHGYGQLTEYFIKHFGALPEDKFFVIAPKGISKFYIKNFTGRIGASWMTKECREYEIADYCRFFEMILEKFKIPKDTVINVFGFSQGVATATRWLVSSERPIGKCVFWAGNMPDDLLDAGIEKISNLDITNVLGDKDEILISFNFDKEAYKNKLNRLLKTEIKSVSFSGGHEIKPEVFNKVFNLP